MLFTCRSWAGFEFGAKKSPLFYLSQRQTTYKKVLVPGMQGLSRNKRNQKVGKKTTRKTIKAAVDLPHFDAPKNDNERLLTYQYNFLVRGDQSAWAMLWQLTEATAGRMLAHECKVNKLKFSQEEWEDKRADAALYILRRYRTRLNYWIEAKFPLHIWYAVRHVLYHQNKRDQIVDYVSGAELDAIIESQNEEV